MRLNPKLIFAALAAGAGAGVMYLLDPETGRRRRALLNDKLKKGANATGDKVSAVAKDVGHRTKGLAIETVQRFKHEELSDEQLAQRVRAELGHHSSNTGDIEVIVQDGRVTLLGPALADEVDGMLEAASKVRGVSAVENRLHMHTEPVEQPALQH